MKEALSKDRASSLEALARYPPDGQAVRDPVLLAEIVPHGVRDLALVPVVAGRKPTDIFVGDRLVVLDPRAAVDPDPAVLILHHHAHARIQREVAVLDASLGAVDHAVVAVEEIPHHSQVWRTVGVLRADDGEAFLLEEFALGWRELGPRH